MEICLDSEVALVTGVGPNTGLETARTLAGAGAKVACKEIDESRAEAAAEFLSEQGGQAAAVPPDIIHEVQAERPA